MVHRVDHAGSAKVQNPEDFIAEVLRDLRIIEAMSHALFVLELVHLVGVEAEGTDDAPDCRCDIDGLQPGLRLSGVAAEE